LQLLIGSLQIDDIVMRLLFVGILSCTSLISMFSSPLFIICILGKLLLYIVACVYLL
jgi:hypothetical protein